MLFKINQNKITFPVCKMSGNIHSGVEEVVEERDNKNDDPITVKQFKDAHDDKTINNVILNTPVDTLDTQRSSTLSNTSDGSLGCEVCNIRVTSAKILQRHLEGRKHKSRAERKGKTFYCELCDVTANSEIQLNIHLTSSKHKSRVAREEYKEFFDVSSYSKSIYILLFAVFCIVINLVILVKVAM